MAWDPGHYDRRSLRHVRAAQLRARAIRWAIGKSLLGSAFLIGALAYVWAPDRHEPLNLAWATGLAVFSTFNIGLGLRTFAKVRRRAGRIWLPATIAWGVLAVVLLKILLLWR